MVPAHAVPGSLVTSWSPTDTGSKTCDCALQAGFLQVNLLFLTAGTICSAVLGFFAYSNAAVYCKQSSLLDKVCNYCTVS